MRGSRVLGLGGDHDLVRVEGRECVGDRKQRVAVADTPFRVDAADLQALDDGGRAALGLSTRRVLVRQPSPEPGVQRGRDDENLCVAARLRG